MPTYRTIYATQAVMQKDLATEQATSTRTHTATTGLHSNTCQTHSWAAFSTRQQHRATKQRFEKKCSHAAKCRLPQFLKDKIIPLQQHTTKVQTNIPAPALSLPRTKMQLPAKEWSTASANGG